MKFLLLAGLLMSGSLMAAETDNSTYCLSYLNGSLGQKPAMMEDFKAVEDVLNIKGQKQKTIVLLPTGDKNFVSDVDTKFDSKTKIETQNIVMSGKNKKGKDVKDYTLIVKRDENGNIVEMRKRYALTDFRPVGDKIEFQTKNGICIPNEQTSGIKRDFNATLCHDLEKFFAENKEARNCMEKSYDTKIADIMAKYHKTYMLMKPRNHWGSLLAGKAIGECYENGLTDMTVDEKVWKQADASSTPSTSSSSETEED